MSEHYTRSTESCLAWCNQCNRRTRHQVSAGRRGRCTEHAAPEMTQAQRHRQEREQRELANPRLFPEREREPGEEG